MGVYGRVSVTYMRGILGGHGSVLPSWTPEENLCEREGKSERKEATVLRVADPVAVARSVSGPSYEYSRPGRSQSRGDRHQCVLGDLSLVCECDTCVVLYNLPSNV